MFALGGLWEKWKDKTTGQVLRTYTILTTDPNELMEPIHNRMPVMLHTEQEALWLDPALTEPDQLAALLHPYEDGGLELSRVSTDVNSTRNNDKHLVEMVRG